MQDFLSLYDYLRRAAGPDLGKEVHKAAKNQNIDMETQKETMRLSIIISVKSNGCIRRLHFQKDISPKMMHH